MELTKMGIKKIGNTSFRASHSTSNQLTKKRKIYDRGQHIEAVGVKTLYHKKLWNQRNREYEQAITQTSKAEILLNENRGFLVPDENEDICDITQHEISKLVDITAASKYFELNLDVFGPYKLRYTNDGRQLLIGGKKGHVASIDWITKKLNCEFNTMQSVADICWLHSENMFAVAQKKYVNVYDKSGTELHCLKKIYEVNCLEFLPFHLLLAAGSESGYLSWLDISIGEIITQFNSKRGRIHAMSQLSENGIIFTGDSHGVVHLWTPNETKSVAYVKCHGTAISALAGGGNEFVTSGLDCFVKIWDSRNLSTYRHKIKLQSTPYGLDLSQLGLVAVAHQSACEVYKKNQIKPYLKFNTDSKPGGLKFCPYEDVLGITTRKSFISILVPGAGEPNVDAYEVNPFQSKRQRNESEVKTLLEKIPKELITLDSDSILRVNTTSANEMMMMKNKIMFIKPPKIDFTPRKKKNCKKSVKPKRKEIVQQRILREFKKTVKPFKNLLLDTKSTNSRKQPNVNITNNSLDRFKSKLKFQS